MSGPERERRTVVDDRGWMICGNVNGVVVDTPKPLSAAVAASYLRVWLPDPFGQLTAEEIAALDPEAARRLGRGES